MSVSSIYSRPTLPTARPLTPPTPPTNAVSTVKVPSGAGSASAPTGGSLSAMNFGALNFSDTINTAGTLGRVYNGVETSINGGQAAQGSVSGIWSAIKSGSGITDAVKGLANVGIAAAKKSAIFSGVISIATNGYRVFKGEESMGNAAANIVGDTSAGAVAGVGAAVAGGIGLSVLGAVGLAGTALTIGGAAVGLVGYVMADHWFRGTQIYNDETSIARNTVNGLMGG